MDRPGALCWLVSGILLELVSGAPLFWSLPQRDCEQPLSYPYDSYQQPGPSYQETLQQMVQETLVALRDIVLITAQVTRQELQALAKELHSKVHRNCDSESTEDVDQYNSDNGQGAELPEENEENNPLQNGYHYNTPNKNINTFATENTAPNTHDTDKGEIENEIDLNKQIFENEISTEEATKFSETTTGAVEETTSNEEMTTEIAVTSTMTTS